MKHRKKIALLGCGRVAAKHVKAIAHAHALGKADLVALADPKPEQSRERLQRWGKGRFPNTRIYPDAKALLAAERPDIVGIATPSGQHFAQAMAALEAGAHLVAEKPLSMHSAEGQQIADLAKAKGLQVAMGHIYRYFPPVADLVEDLQRGRYGKPRYGSLVVRWGHEQAYYDASPWRGTRQDDGGVIMNQSVHALDLMRWFLGEAPLVHVKADCARISHVMESEDFGLGIFRFDNGAWASLEASTATLPIRQEARFFVAYEDLEIRLAMDRKRPSLSLTDKQGKELRWPYLRKALGRLWRREGLRGFLQLGNPHSAIYMDLLAAIDEGRPPLAPVASGVASVAMVEAMIEAAGPLHIHQDLR